MASPNEDKTATRVALPKHQEAHTHTVLPPPPRHAIHAQQTPQEQQQQQQQQRQASSCPQESSYASGPMLPNRLSLKQRARLILSLTRNSSPSHRRHGADHEDIEEPSTSIEDPPEEESTRNHREDDTPATSFSRRRRTARPGIPPIRPGAVAVDGPGRRQHGDEESQEEGTIIIGGNTIVPNTSATMQEMEPLPATLAPSRRSKTSSKFLDSVEARVVHDRAFCKRISALLLLLAAIGIAVAIGVRVSPVIDASTKTPNTPAPTDPPQQGHPIWVLLGQPNDIVGRVQDAQLGTRVAISGDGHTIAAWGNGNPMDGDTKQVGVPEPRPAVPGSATGQQPYILSFSVADNDNSTELLLGSPIAPPLWSNRIGAGLALAHDGTVLATLGGSALVYRYNRSDWVEYGPDHQGCNAISLSADGSTVAVVHRSTRGIHVFHHDPSVGAWSQLGPTLWLYPDTPPTGSDLSISLSEHGDRLAVGNPTDDAHGEYSGSIQVFDFDGNDWIQKGTDLVGFGEYDDFAHSVSLADDGNCVAGGAPIRGNQDRPGYALVHCLAASGEWTRRGNTLAGQSGSRFGNSVDLSADGRTLVVGAPEANSNDGQVSLFRYEDDTDSWKTIAVFEGIMESYEYCGFSLSLSSSGDKVVVGCPRTQVAGVVRAGSVRVYREIFILQTLAPTTSTPPTLEPIAVRQRLDPFLLQGGDELDDPESYQNCALSRTESHRDIWTASIAKTVQYYALYSIYCATYQQPNILTDSDPAIQESGIIPAWVNNAGWTDDTLDPCVCSALNSDDLCEGVFFGIVCDPASDMIIEIDLDRNQLSGSWPPEVALLAGDGPRSSGAGNLEYLGIYLNEFLYNNEQMFWIPLLGSSLRFLYFGFTGFVGDLPAMPSGLIELGASKTLISGGLSGATFANSSDIEYIDVSDCVLKGTLPSEIGNSAALEELLLYGNMLEGTIPTEIVQVTSLKTFWVFENELYGEMPSNMCLNYIPFGLLESMSADCDGAVPEVSCSCCSCCNRDDCFNS